MKKALKVLYITFVDFDSPSESGSAVRPKRMYDAFVKMKCDVMLVSGISNDRKKRKEAVLRARKWLTANRPDICYIEPPTGPLFFACDRNLIRKLHRMHVPIAFFYRDIYWKFKERDFRSDKSGLIDALKGAVVKVMQYRDFLMLKRCVNKFYFPSDSVNKYMKLKEYGALPPGCVKKKITRVEHECITGIYVGGATERYGIGLLLDAWMKIQVDCRTKLIVVCPQAQWETWLKEYPKYKQLPDNIQVFHLCDGKELEKLYALADFALIPVLKTSYNNIGLPIKLYEYLSNELPIVATNCFEIQRVIQQNKIGIVVEDDVSSFSAGIEKMIADEELYHELIENCVKAKMENTWEKRAEKIVCDLME